MPMSKETYKSLIVEAIRSLKDRKGSTFQEIAECIKANNPATIISDWSDTTFGTTLQGMVNTKKIEMKGTRYIIANEEIGFQLPPANHALGNMADLWRNEQLCDAEVVSSGGQSFKAHRLVLASSSDYMKALLAEDRFKDSSGSTINLPDVSSASIKVILQWMYGCQCKVEGAAEAADAMEAACHLQCTKLVDELETGLCDIAKTANCIELWTLGKRLNLTKLPEKAKQVAIGCFRDLSQTERFVNIEFRELLSLVKEDALNIENEDRAYEAVLIWIKNNLQNERCNIEEAKQIFAHIRVPEMSKDFLLKSVMNEPLLDENPILLKTLFGSAIGASTKRTRLIGNQVELNKLEIGMYVRIIDDAAEFKRLQNNGVGWEEDDMKYLAGAVVEIKSIDRKDDTLKVEGNGVSCWIEVKAVRHV